MDNRKRKHSPDAQPKDQPSARRPWRPDGGQQEADNRGEESSAGSSRRDQLSARFHLFYTLQGTDLSTIHRLTDKFLDRMNDTSQGTQETIKITREQCEAIYKELADHAAGNLINVQQLFDLTREVAKSVVPENE